MSVDAQRTHNYDTVESESADVFVVLLSIYNALDINLYDALLAKEMVNYGREWVVSK